MQNFDLLTARVVLRGVQKGLPVAETLQLVEALLDGYDDAQDCLDDLMKLAWQGKHAEIAMVCELMKGDLPPCSKADYHG
jgi:hypothetical protein